MEIPIIQGIHLGPLTLQVWGLFVGGGIYVAYLLASKRFKKLGISIKHLDNLFLIAIVLSFVGARLLFILIEYQYYFSQPLAILKIWEGGLAFTGGLLLVLPAIIWYVKKHQLDWWQVADALAIPLAAALAIGRFGCLFTGLHIGFVTEFGAVFNVGGELRVAWPFYAIINWLVAVGALLWLEKKGLAKGMLALTMLLWWSAWRFFGDFIRADASVIGGDPRYMGLTPTQYLAGAVLVVVIIIFFKQGKRRAALDQ